MMTEAIRVSHLRLIRRSSFQPTITARPAASHSAAVAPIPTATGSRNPAARLAVTICVRSPNSARKITANDVPATGQNACRTSRLASSSSSSAFCRHSMTAPARNATAVAA